MQGGVIVGVEEVVQAFRNPSVRWSFRDGEEFKAFFKSEEVWVKRVAVATDSWKIVCLLFKVSSRYDDDQLVVIPVPDGYLTDKTDKEVFEAALKYRIIWP